MQIRTIDLFLFHAMLLFARILLDTTTIVCSGSVVVTAYDFESGRPGSNPEWGVR